MASRTDSTLRLTRLALLAALALMLSFLEGLFPPLLPVPIKLGLANVAVLAALELLGPGCAALVQLARCILGPLIGGSPIGALYSLSGGALSLLAMCALHPLTREAHSRAANTMNKANRQNKALDLSKARRPVVSLIGVSIAGAFFHTLGQLMMGAALVGPAVMAYYTPMELLSVPAGFFVGMLAMLAIRVEKVVN